MKGTLLLPLVAVAAASVLGCSPQQLYGAGQAWQRNECFKINDPQEQSRCLSSSATSYEQYKRETQAATQNK